MIMTKEQAWNYAIAMSYAIDTIKVDRLDPSQGMSEMTKKETKGEMTTDEIKAGLIRLYELAAFKVEER